MKLSFILGEAGFTPDELNVECTITLGDGVITESALVVKGKVPKISNEKFVECAEEARKTCPISKSLNTKITVQASLA
jgi:osmotically inducible protein OsmC